MQFTRKIILLSGGVLLAFLILEGSLRVAGNFQKHTRIHEEKDSDGEGYIRVICLGDSVTWGAGASPNMTYPEQLQKLLGEKYKVYNAGEQGSNSSMTLNQLIRWGERYNPDIVVILTGHNDSWNLQDSNYYLFTEGNRKTFYRLKKRLFSLRTLKLIGILRSNFQDEKKDNYSYVSSQVDLPLDFKEKIEWVEKIMEEGDFDSADALLEELNQDAYLKNEEAYFTIGYIYRALNNHEKAIEFFKEAVKLNPKHPKALKDLLGMYVSQNMEEEAKETAKKLSKHFPDEGGLENLLRFGLPERTILPDLLKFNMEKMIIYARERDIDIILQTYPNPSPVYHSKVISELSKKYGLPFVDNDAEFSRQDNIEDYLRSNRFHPNDEGYGLIARNVFKVIIKAE